VNAPLSRPAEGTVTPPFRELTRAELKDPTILLVPIAELLLQVIGGTDAETAEERAMEASRNIVAGLVDGQTFDVFRHITSVITSPMRMHPMVADSRRTRIAHVAMDVTLLYIDLAGRAPGGAPISSELQRFTLAIAAGVPMSMLRRAWGKR